MGPADEKELESSSTGAANVEKTAQTHAHGNGAHPESAVDDREANRQSAQASSISEDVNEKVAPPVQPAAGGVPPDKNAPEKQRSKGRTALIMSALCVCIYDRGFESFSSNQKLSRWLSS